jgi:MFS family permease
MLIASFAGGHLLDLVGERNIFLISACFPILTLLTAFLLVENPRQRNDTLSEWSEDKKQLSVLNKLRENAKVIGKTLRIGFIFKPLVVILLVIIAPSVDDAMYYFSSDILHFSSS